MPPSKSKRRPTKGRFTSRAAIKRMPSIPAPSQTQQLNPIVNKIVRAAGAMGAAAIGLNPLAGEYAANKAHSVFKDITGWGEYKVKGNTLMTNNSTPIFRVGNRSTRIRHKEFIMDVASSTNFQLLLAKGEGAINPMNKALFPWLSNVASNYQQFKFHGLVFGYESRSGNSVGSTTTNLGTVLLATLYNSYSLPPRSKQEMEALEFTTAIVPSQNMVHPIECSPHEQVVEHYYTRMTPGADERFSVMGRLLLASVGQQLAGANLGELWVSYDVELLKPKVAQPSVSTHILPSIATVDANHWLGLTPTVNNTDLPITIDAPGSIITFPSSYYGAVEVSLIYTCSAPAAYAYPTVGLVGNVAYNPIFVNDSTAIVAENTTGQTQIVIFSLNINGGGSISLLGGTVPTPLVSADIFIEEISEELQ